MKDLEEKINHTKILGEILTEAKTKIDFYKEYIRLINEQNYVIITQNDSFCYIRDKQISQLTKLKLERDIEHINNVIVEVTQKKELLTDDSKKYYISLINQQ